MLRSYPYDELSCYARAFPDRVDQMLDTLRYFDAVNFAPRIKCPMAVGIAMEDEVCPPETGYAAYRLLGGERELRLFPESGHGNAHELSGLGSGVATAAHRRRRIEVISDGQLYRTHNAAFWERIEAGLAETAPDVALERDAFYSQPEWDVYRMRYDTTDGHRLFAWLSIPKERGPHDDGPFPALVRMPDYASVHDIIYTLPAPTGRGAERHPPGPAQQRRPVSGQLPRPAHGRD